MTKPLPHVPMLQATTRAASSIEDTIGAIGNTSPGDGVPIGIAFEEIKRNVKLIRTEVARLRGLLRCGPTDR